MYSALLYREILTATEPTRTGLRERSSSADVGVSFGRNGRNN